MGGSQSHVSDGGVTRVVWDDDDGEARSAVPAEGRAPSEEFQTTITSESRKGGAKLEERVFFEMLYEDVIFRKEKRR
jgi:hypothetical protein